MEAVFLLWHFHDLGDGKTDDELLGIYSSVDEAEAAKARKLAFEGFRSPSDGFLINRHALNRDGWSRSA
jgi:hypothetical protein